VHHGVGVAMFLPAAMAFNRPHLPDRFTDIATALKAGDPIRAGDPVHAVRELIAGCPIPGPADLGITAADVPALTAKVLDDKFHIGLNPVPITETDVTRILKSVVGNGLV
jgi:alcohol dehydrogenase class IV